jgi:NitT/TauT family transport system permease protein
MRVWQQTGIFQALGVAIATLVAMAAGGWTAAPAPVMTALVATLMLFVVHHGLGWTRRTAAWWLPGLFLVVIAANLWNTGLPLVPAATRAPWFGATSVAVWLLAWWLVAHLAEARRAKGLPGRLQALLAPLLFGATLLWLWEVVVRALDVPRVILPAPSAIWARIITSTDVLWVDFVQTFVKGALSGYAIGVSAAIVFALLVERSDFLRRGLLPVGSFLAALPIIGTAPIMVMWFGFDWPSKAAVVVAMVFFPVLVNTVQGLAAADHMQRDLMHTYSASWAQSLFKLRLPAAMPFIFNGMKVASTLALIGAIVAEFFGSPTRGMGFRISTEVGRLQLDMVWAEIAVAALAGSLFYGLIALVERGVTFWHPSQRGR